MQGSVERNSSAAAGLAGLLRNYRAISSEAHPFSGGAAVRWSRCWAHGRGKHDYGKNTVARNQAYSFMSMKASIGPMELRVFLNTRPRANISAAMTSEFAP